MTEVWKQFRDLNYEVSSIGRVRKTKASKRAPAGYILSPCINKSGYPAVTIRINGENIRFTLGQLVCETFHGKRPNGKPHSAHRDGIKTNNTPENLRWATVSENKRDTIKHGLVMPNGEKHHNSKLNDALVVQLRKRRLAGEKLIDIAKEMGVSKSTIYFAAGGYTWSHLPGSVKTKIGKMDIK